MSLKKLYSPQTFEYCIILYYITNSITNLLDLATLFANATWFNIFLFAPNEMTFRHKCGLSVHILLETTVRSTFKSTKQIPLRKCAHSPSACCLLIIIHWVCPTKPGAVPELDSRSHFNPTTELQDSSRGVLHVCGIFRVHFRPVWFLRTG